MPIKRVKKVASAGRGWLFALATRLAEFINMAALIGFSFFMLLGFDRLVLSHPYRKFTYASSKLFWIGVMTLGLFQLMSMLRFSIRSNQVSGITLQVSSIVWLVFAVTFGLDYPPLSTALPIYSLLAFVTISAGHELLAVNKCIEVEINKDS